MKGYERFDRFNDFNKALLETPVKGAQVREAHDALTQATTSLTKAETAHEQATVRFDECTARVRDATKVARPECRKGRAFLVAKGVEIAAHAVQRGGTPRAILSRSAAFLRKAQEAGLKLPELGHAREQLEVAFDAQTAARKARVEKSDVLDAARSEWDACYSEVRVAIEAQLRHEHLRGDALQARLDAYFPRQVEHRDGAEPQTPPPSSETPAA